MQLDWFNLSAMATWTLLFVLLFLGLGTTALLRLRARRRVMLAAYVDVAPQTASQAAPQTASQAAPQTEFQAEPQALPQTESQLGLQIEPLADVERRAAEPAAATAVPRPAPQPEGALAGTPGAVVIPVDAVAAKRQKLRLQAGLARTQHSLLGRITQIFARKGPIDAHVLDEIEEVLLTADVGVRMAMQLMDDLRAQHKQGGLESDEAVRGFLRARLQAALTLPSHSASAANAVGSACAGPRPKVILFVGVNGVGKTTTIGKMAAKLTAEGQRVLLAAGDTFRAAAAEQLLIWGERSGARVVRGAAGADPASVMFNAVEAAKQGDFDIVLADTAGRLHTKVELMDELKKVRRAIDKVRPGAPDATWLVVDATTGQNALQQAVEFHQALTLTGVILTKLDGTAKGGIVVAIMDALKIPVLYVGVGEGADDLMPFSAEQFVAALFTPAEVA